MLIDRDPSCLVRVDSLAPGQRFVDVQGSTWTYERRDGSLAGVYHCNRSDGFVSCFAGCAEVIPEAVP